jgi:hypothetical protein
MTSPADLALRVVVKFEGFPRGQESAREIDLGVEQTSQRCFEFVVLSPRTGRQHNGMRRFRAFPAVTGVHRAIGRFLRPRTAIG